MKNTMKITAAIIVSGLMAASSALADLNAETSAQCSAKGVAKGLSGFVAGKIKKVSKAITKIEAKCLPLTDPTEYQECIDGAAKKLQAGLAKLEAKKFGAILKGCDNGDTVTVADYLVDAEFLSNDPNDATDLAYLNEEVDCETEGVNLAAGTVDGDVTPKVCTNKATAGRLCDVNVDCDKKVGAADGVCTAATGGLVWAICIDRRMDRKVEDIIKEMHPRSWALLADANDLDATTDPNDPVGALDILTYLPIGKHKVEGVTIASLNNPGAIPMDPIPTSYVIDIGAVNSDGYAEITVPATSFDFGAVKLQQIPAINTTVCVGTPKDASGFICCDPNGCPALGLGKNYSVCQDHDVSISNTNIGGENFASDICAGGTLDPSCTSFKINQLSLLDAEVDTASREGSASGVATNASAIGNANEAAHFPKCLDGLIPDGTTCDPAYGNGQCGAAGDCSSYTSIGGTPTLLDGSPCNGPVHINAAAGGFNEGDMILKQSIQFTLHPNRAEEIVPFDPADRAIDFAPSCCAVAGCGVGLPLPLCDNLVCTKCSDGGVPSAAGPGLPECIGTTREFCMEGTCADTNADGKAICNAAQICVGGSAFGPDLLDDPLGALGGTPGPDNDGALEGARSVACVTFLPPTFTTSTCVGGGGTCVGTSDRQPDGYGADALPCTGDDTSTPQPATSLYAVTGNAAGSVVDNGLDASFLVHSTTLDANESGTNPGAGACANLSVSVTEGFALAGTFPSLDGAGGIGDAVTTVKQCWEDPCP